MTSRSASPSGRADSVASALRVQIRIDDPDLAARVRRALAGIAEFAEAGADAPLVLTDRSAALRPDGADPAGQWADGKPALSRREREVAGLLLEGASNKSIARRLDISVHTAKFHVTQIREKLGAINRSDAVSIILRDGLVTL